MTPNQIGPIFAGPIFFDFDGPIADVFSGLPAHDIAADLLALIERFGVQLQRVPVGETDPMEVLRWSGTIGRPDVLTAVEDALCAAELRACAVSEPTPHTHDLIRNAAKAGRRIAIVSNNSAPAIELYLSLHNLTDYIDSVIGRTIYHPDLMKPNPFPLHRAATTIGAAAPECVLIGDSLSDIHGAQAANVPVIAYANKSHKIRAFSDAGADVVVTDMVEVPRLLAVDQ